MHAKFARNVLLAQVVVLCPILLGVISLISGEARGVGFSDASNQSKAQSSGQDDSTHTQQLQSVTSLFGKELLPPAFTVEQQAKLLLDLAKAQERYDASPNDADALIWLGRRLAYLWRYQDAVAMFTLGIEQHPDDPRMYRHRGHRYITLRQFDKAIADFEKAAELINGTEDKVEPDGQPNAAGVPTSTLHTNVWYHLGLAYYLTGDFDKALAAYENCLAAAKNNDMRVATLDWMWMTLRRLGREEDAAKAIAEVTPELEILENTAYHRRLLMYQGKLSPTDLIPAEDASDQQTGDDDSTAAALNLATYGYAVGNWHLIHGEPQLAAEFFRRTTSGEHWAAFGFIASEAELKRMADK